MTASPPKANSRRGEIADYLIEVGQARIDDLAERFGVSRMTIHRHVDELARQGLLRKLHGHVTLQPTGLYESAYRYRATVREAEKKALARAAVALIEPGQAVMLDDSSTASALAPLLEEVGPLTVITNSMVVVNIVAGFDDVELICIGGRFHPTYQAFIGPIAERIIGSLRANVLFCSASAVEGTTCFVQDAQVTQVKQAMMAAATRRVLLLDDGKLGKTALNVLADLKAFDDVLMTDGVEADERRRLDEAGVSTTIVKTKARET